ERILAWFKIEQHEQAEPASSETHPKQTILAAAIGHAVRPANGKLPQDPLVLTTDWAKRLAQPGPRPQREKVSCAARHSLASDSFQRGQIRFRVRVLGRPPFRL